VSNEPGSDLDEQGGPLIEARTRAGLPARRTLLADTGVGRSHVCVHAVENMPPRRRGQSQRKAALPLNIKLKVTK